MLRALILYLSSGTYSLKSDPNDRFFEKLFHGRFILLSEFFSRNLLKEKWQVYFTFRVFGRSLLKGKFCVYLLSWCFLFYQKMYILFKKNAILCWFLKNVSPSKTVICFILNNSHLLMVKGIAFYVLYKSRVLIIPYKADDSSLFIELPDEIYKKASGFVIQF